MIGSGLIERVIAGTHVISSEPKFQWKLGAQRSGRYDCQLVLFARLEA